MTETLADDETADEEASGSSAVVPWVAIYLKGLAMGTADAIPGVSGGTIALVTGIYDRLISAIASFDPRVILAVLQPWDPEARREVRDLLLEMDVWFLAALGLGVVTGISTVARVLELALHEYRVVTFAFFFGLIAASAIVLYRHVSVDTPRRAAVSVAGLVFAFVLVGEFRAVLPDTLPVIFLIGAVSISAMILPGVSGSFLLLAFGKLGLLSTALNDFNDAILGLVSGGSVAKVIEPGTLVVTYMAGAAVGVLTIARVIEYALEHYRAATLAFLVSVMVGALRLPIREVGKEATWTGSTVVVVVVAAIVGGALVIGLDHYTEQIGYE